MVFRLRQVLLRSPLPGLRFTSANPPALTEDKSSCSSSESSSPSRSSSLSPLPSPSGSLESSSRRPGVPDCEEPDPLAAAPPADSAARTAKAAICVSLDLSTSCAGSYPGSSARISIGFNSSSEKILCRSGQLLAQSIVPSISLQNVRIFVSRTPASSEISISTS